MALISLGFVHILNKVAIVSNSVEGNKRKIGAVLSGSKVLNFVVGLSLFCVGVVVGLSRSCSLLAAAAL